jgi:hypothetical protein
MNSPWIARLLISLKDLQDILAEFGKSIKPEPKYLE